MKNLGKTAILLALSLGAAGASDVNTDCTQLQGAKPQVQLEYLQGERSALSDACMIYAMDRLAAVRYAPSIDLLVKYLDYHIPAPPKSKEAFVQQTVPWLGTWYPAARGLFRIGKDAVPALIAAIADADTSDLMRKNDIELVLLIYREDVPQGAAVLNRAGRTATRPDVRQRLLDAARDLAGQCPEPQRGACLANALK
jgi:hypothetical protein